jgi:uncharacterized protein
MNRNPALPGARVHIIDAIRGLAILGILFANIQSWSGYKYVGFETIEALPLYHLDVLFMHLNNWLVDGKFYAIFSILFGAGFGLMFGVCHALLWSGDILTLYALLAFVLVMMRNLDYEKLLPVAVFLLCAFALPQVAMLLLAEPSIPTQALAHKTYSDMSPQVISDAFVGGDWSDMFSVNLHNLYWRWCDFLPNGRISRVLGLFVLGFYLVRSGYFVKGIYRRQYLLAFLLLGVAATGAAQYADTNITKWAVSGGDVMMKMVLVSGQVLLALAYMSILAQIFSLKIGQTLLFPLTLIGRMAFTSYLMQSVIGIALFSGVGLGYWGTMGLAQLWLLATVIYTAQVLFAAAWLQFFIQGPVEWLWGCLTAGVFKNNRRVPVVSMPG